MTTRAIFEDSSHLDDRRPERRFGAFLWALSGADPLRVQNAAFGPWSLFTGAYAWVREAR